MRFEVAERHVGFYGGTTRVHVLDGAARPADAGRRRRFDATYRTSTSRSSPTSCDCAGIRLTGRASGANLLEWPLGRFAEHRGDGQVDRRSAADRAWSSMQPTPAASRGQSRATCRAVREWGPFSPLPWSTHLPVAGDVTYAFDPEWSS